MAQLTPIETRILEFAEKREHGSKHHTLDEFGWRETAYTQRLLQLVGRPDVEADQRWTMLVHRIPQGVCCRCAAQGVARVQRLGVTLCPTFAPRS